MSNFLKIFFNLYVELKNKIENFLEESKMQEGDQIDDFNLKI